VTRTGVTSSVVDRPYPGTRPFQQNDHDRFFGRAACAANLVELWRSNRLTIAFGPVASGKTSLLNAGVFPLISDTRTELFPVGRVSYDSTFPAAALPEHNPYTLSLLRSWSPSGESVTRLAGLSVLNFVRHRAERHSGAIFATVDQIEELFADSGWRNVQRRRFLNELFEAVREVPRLHLLLVVRDEAVGLLKDVFGGGAKQRVEPLSPQSAFDAVTRPIVAAGKAIASEAAEKLVADLRTSRAEADSNTERGPQSLSVEDHVEPSLLQVVCSRLWKELPSDIDVITVGDMKRFGDADTALTDHCGRILSQVAEYQEILPSELRSWLLRSFVTDLGTRGIVYEGVTDTAGMPSAVARGLEDMHLLSTQRRSGARWYELLSGRLIGPLRRTNSKSLQTGRPVEYLRAAERAFILGELDLAERYAKTILHMSPATDLRLQAEADSFLGNLAYEREKPAEAGGLYREAAILFEAIEDIESVARQLAASGKALLAQGRLAEGVQQLHAAVDRAPNDVVIRTGFGLALWQFGEGRAAIAELTTALEIDGGNPDALRARGEILAYIGDPRAAMRDLDRVASNMGSLTLAARGLVFARLGEHRTAIRNIEDAVAVSPRNGLVLLYAARATAIGGDEAGAEELARRAVDSMDPPLAPQHRELALQLAGRKFKKLLGC
jgi:tetratricopeptide (TPR) repeat protein